MLRFPKFVLKFRQLTELLNFLAQNISTFVERYITAFTTRISFKDSSTKYLLRWGVDFRQVSSDILAPFSKPAHGWLGRIVNFWQEPHHIGWAKVALVLEERRWKSCCWCFRSCHRSCFLILVRIARTFFVFKNCCLLFWTSSAYPYHLRSHKFQNAHLFLGANQSPLLFQGK